MNIHPTRATFHVALAGAALVALGSAARVPIVVAFGGAMILAVAAGRAIALVTVTRLRAAGFEMVWGQSQRVVRMGRGDEVTLHAELRNRSPDAMSGVAVRAIVSSMLDVRVTPTAVDLPPGCTTQIRVTVRGKRVGRWGIHGVALEVRGAPPSGEGLYEVPLLFANPFGIEVFPAALFGLLRAARGGRSRRFSEVGRPAAAGGEGEELREIRNHVAGDPFKRIAWKASARRGQLLVRQMERDERDVVMLVLDASIELWAGPEGQSALDRGIDEMSALATRHLARGDQVGLVVFASRLRSLVPPAKGAAHALKLAAALASAASTVDADRSELDEIEVAARVAEHARPLDPHGLSDVPKGNLDMLTARAEVLRGRAPFAPRLPYARSPREQRLRLYLAAFGVEPPPRVDGEHVAAAAMLPSVIERLAAEKPRASIVHVWAPAPTASIALLKSVQRLKRRRTEVRWTLPSFENSVATDAPHAPAGPAHSKAALAVAGAVRLRAEAARIRGERTLRRMGVQLHRAPWYPPDRARLARAPS